MTKTERSLSNLNKKLCELVSNDNNAIIETLLEEIRDLLQADTEQVTPTLFCDVDCNITGGISYYRDEDTGLLTPIYFDSSLQVTTVAPTGNPCSGNCTEDDYEFKFFEIEKCLTDCSKVLEVLCISYINAVETSTSTFWIVNGIKVDTDPGVQDCSNCIEECTPLIESFVGDNASLAEYNELEVFIPKCCVVTITTSAGVFTLPTQSIPWVYTKKFNCPLTSYSITSTCDVDTITTILSKTI